MAIHSIFDYQNYKTFLRAKAGPKDSRSGVRAAIAKYLNCQQTYISQVLYKDADLSLEHAEKLVGFFEFDPEEKNYWLLMVQVERAGTVSLKNYFREQMNELVRKRLTITERLGKNQKLSEHQQAVYYSSWQYAAVHVALGIPELQTYSQLKNYLNIQPDRLTEILNFLCTTGLASKKDNKYLTGEVQVRIGKDSPLVVQHHGHWRQQAIESLEREEITDLHYTGVISLSEKDVTKLKNHLMETIRTSLEIVRPSKEEKLYNLNIDFYHLKKNISQ